MRSSIRTITAALLGALALSAVAASAASALSWKVEGHELTTGESAALSEHVAVRESFRFSRSGYPTVECSSLTDKNGLLQGPSKGSAEGLVFSACTVPQDPTTCEAGSENSRHEFEAGIIRTEAVALTLEAGAPIKVKIAPAAGEVFIPSIRVKFKGEQSCGASFNFHPLDGFLSGSLSSAETESTAHLLTIGAGNELRAGGGIFTVRGKAELTLASGKQWSA